MKGITQASKKPTRSKKGGLLTEREREFLKYEIKFNYKQRWEFFKLISNRIDACAEDLKIIWKSTKVKDSPMSKWASANWDKLYSLGESIHPRHYGNLQPYFPGKIRIRYHREKGKKRSTKLYWFDENRKYLEYTESPWPDYVLRGIKPHSERDKIKKALLTEEKTWYRPKPIGKKSEKIVIVPRTAYDAINIEEISKNTEKVIKLLKK